MSKMIQTPWEAMQSAEPARSNTYEKYVHDKGGMIVVYDSQGRMLEVRSVYGAFDDSNESEGNDDGNRNA